jgi:hypothetical protein
MMGRLDFGSGRFDADYETNDIHEALQGWASEFGDKVLYYRYWGEHSQVHDIWDEASGVGRVWHPPHEVEVLHVTHVEGGNQDRQQGQYYNDNLYLTASFEQLKRLGMTELDLQHQTYLRDRIIYDYRVFRVTRLQVRGQIQQRDVIVSIEGTQVKPDEMLNDIGFEAFANPLFPEKP